MTAAIRVLGGDDLPRWLELPHDYLTLVEMGRDEFLPWYLMSAEQARIRFEGLRERYPDRELVPFARKDLSDDVACWERGKPGAVQVIHDFASPGWEQREEHATFQSWYQSALRESDTG